MIPRAGPRHRTDSASRPDWPGPGPGSARWEPPSRPGRRRLRAAPAAAGAGGPARRRRAAGRGGAGPPGPAGIEPVGRRGKVTSHCKYLNSLALAGSRPA
jgi:hypothetical protein